MERLLSAILAALLLPCVAFADAERGRMLPAGLVAPSAAQAVTDNPSALPDIKEKGIVFEAGPSILGSSTDQYAATITLGHGSWGGGVAIENLRYPTSTQTTVTGGVGYRPSGNGKVSLGADFGMTSSSYSQALSNQLALSLTLGSGSDFNTSFVLGGLTSGTLTPSFGLGVIQPKKHTLEFNVALPPLSYGLTTTGATYDFALAGTIYEGAFGLGFSAHKAIVIGTGFESSVLTHEFSLLFAPSSIPAISIHWNGGVFGYIALTHTY